MRHPKFTRAFEVVADLPEALQPLNELASNYRWTWDHEAREIFRAVDKALWNDSDRNPVMFLNSLKLEKVERLAEDPSFVARLNGAVESLRAYLKAETWFDHAYPKERERTTIAYFCAEFGISEGLPIYSGGLGVLAGDHLKAASDLGIPLVAVGLLYNRGYFRQRLTHDGWQVENYPNYDFYQMPLQLMRDQDERPLRITIEFPDRNVTLQVWRAMVGRVPLYLLDSNVMENAPVDQGITDTLYGGDEDMRIRQEMILGIGGMRALKALGIDPTVCHMNEGHAAFLSVERIRQVMEAEGCDFRTARQWVVSGNVFTTHTPVPAGFDLFKPELLERYMGKAVASTGLNFGEFLKLGRIEPENPNEPFNMAVLAMENANWVNGVSKLHAAVTRTMFSSRWPEYPEDEVPVRAVTNGVHTMTWIGRRMANLFDEHLGSEWRRNPEDPLNWANVDNIPDDELWETLENQRGDLVRFVRRHVSNEAERLSKNGKPEFGSTGGILDPRVLTIGFARRFATYKRGTLMLRNPDRLKALLHHPERPIQIIIAGKSHPRDDGGKKLIQELVQFIAKEGLQHRMVFLEDYDMKVARQMVQGVDLWLNNPRRPYEASGTSGMKVLANGGLNLSILDGWWDEAYQPGVGWAIGDRTNDPNEGHQDWLDSLSLYGLLENEIAPMFYHRLEGGIPKGWLHSVKRSIKELANVFSTNRMVQEYTERFYMPSAISHHRLSEDGMSRAKAALDWRDKVRRNWGSVRVAHVYDTADSANTLGAKVDLKVGVTLGELTPDDLRVQAVVGKVGPNRDLLHTQVQDLTFVEHADGLAHFVGTVQCDHAGYQGYTVRIVPFHEDVDVKSELGLVAWQSEG